MYYKGHWETQQAQAKGLKRKSTENRTHHPYTREIETDSTNGLNLAGTQIRTWTHLPGLEPSQNPDWDLNPPPGTRIQPNPVWDLNSQFKIRITHQVSGPTEVQVLHASVQKEFSERQSDRQEIDVLRQDTCERCKRAATEALPPDLVGYKRSGGWKRPFLPLSSSTGSFFVSSKLCIQISRKVVLKVLSLVWIWMKASPHPLANNSHTSTSQASLSCSDGFFEQFINLPWSPNIP